MKQQIVLIPFPFDDLSATKVRPVLCLTNPIGPHSHLIVAFITSMLPPAPLSSDYTIDDKHPDFKMTGLRVSSTLRLHRMMTISASMLQRKLGRLPEDMQAEVSTRLRSLFDL